MTAAERTVEQILDETYETDDRPPRKPAYHLPKKIDHDKLPLSLKRARSAYGFLASWKKLRDAVWTARGIPYNKLPEFAHRWGKRLYETHEREAYEAVVVGDVMFFEAWSARLLMIDHAAEEAGLTIPERGTILFAYGVLKGYGDASAKQLKKLGGKWPPAR